MSAAEILDCGKPRPIKIATSSETSTQKNSVALKVDPIFTKFFKMFKMGMLRDAVKHAMKRDCYDSSMLDGDPNLPAMDQNPETPQSQRK